MTAIFKHENVNVEFEERRWRTLVKISDAVTGELIETYVASADSFYTEGSSIWFGTLQEYEDAKAD